MPFYRKRSYGSKRKNSNSRKRIRRARSNYITRRPRTLGRLPGVGFPLTMKMRHKYVESFTMGTSSGFGATHRFNATGLYDPNDTGVGHQPMFFDQMAAIYDHYTVLGAVIKWTVTPEGETDYPPIKVIVFHNDDTTTALSDPDAIQEQKNAAAQAMVLGSDTKSIHFTQRYSPRKTFAMNPVNNNHLQGTPTTNAPETHFFEIFIKALDNAAIVNVYVNVQITYLVLWKELKEVAPS